MDIIKWESLSANAQQEALLRPAQADRSKVSAIVKDIIDNIKTKKDQALFEYLQKFDKCTDQQVEYTEQEIEQACSRVTGELKEAIDQAYLNIKKFHEAQSDRHISVETVNGIVCESLYHPIESVGLYVPGGSAPLVSTALMLGVPAQIAKCEQVILTSPFPVSDAIIYAASLCNIKRIFKMGGAQAIAAMAYGTESVPKVNKIFGPGNQFVTMAKSMVSDDPQGAAIDMPAGPSEVLVIADHQADPDFVAADLLSQAEHGPDSQVILVSDNQEILNKVTIALEQQLAVLPRKEIAQKALSKSRFILASSLAECVAISNQYAPEHLIVQTQNPRDLLPSLRNAGSIFLGQYTCESMGDYASGTNHTLPTYGYAKTASALGTDDFRRRYTVSQASAEGLQQIGKTVEVLADAEGLFAHRNAVTIRLNKLQAK